jgi:hypothetical protein
VLTLQATDILYLIWKDDYECESGNIWDNGAMTYFKAPVQTGNSPRGTEGNINTSVGIVGPRPGFESGTSRTGKINSSLISEKSIIVTVHYYRYLYV